MRIYNMKNRLGGIDMAESSITHNFILTDPDEIEMFFKALEESANEPPRPSTVNVKFLDDSDEIRECMEKTRSRD